RVHLRSVGSANLKNNDAFEVHRVRGRVRAVSSLHGTFSINFCRQQSTRIMLDPLSTIVGGSPAMIALKAYLPKVAESSATVLITGETGTGKECVAKAIHNIGSRSRNQ